MIEILAMCFIAMIIFFATFITAVLAENDSTLAFVIFFILALTQSILSAYFVLTIIGGV